MRPDWFTTLAADERPLMEALDDLVQGGGAEWVEN